MGVDGGGACHRKEDGKRLQVAFDVIISHRLQVDIFADVNKIEYVRRGSGKNGDEAVNHIIRLLMHEQEHRCEGDEFEHDGTHRDITVLFKRLIQPFHSDGGQKDGKADYDIQLPVFSQSRHENQRQCKQYIRYDAHDQIDAEKFMRRAGKFLPVVSYL